MPAGALVDWCVMDPRWELGETCSGVHAGESEGSWRSGRLQLQLQSFSSCPGLQGEAARPIGEARVREAVSGITSQSGS